MTQSGTFPIPVTILTGFLGAGKTTLLNRILNADHGLRVAVLVNDFGAINIDSQLVVDVREEDTIELANGCICCTIRGDLLGALLKLVAREEPPEYILIEASGVSDPLEIALTFKQPELGDRIRVDSILTVIDAEQVLNLDRENRVLAVLQVGAADIVVMNKVDLVDESQREQVRQWVRSIIKEARILEATHGNVPLELMLGVGMFDPVRMESNRDAPEVHVHSGDEAAHHHHDHSLVFDTWSWTSAQPLSLRAIKTAIESLPPSIYRAKGIVYLADDETRSGVLQVVGKRASFAWGRAWRDEELRHSQIVVIGAHGEIDADALQARFERCLAANVPKSELGWLARGMVSWLRGTG